MKTSKQFILNKYFIISFGCSSLFSSCNQATDFDIKAMTEKPLTQLGMSAQLEETLPQTRTNTFPNDAQISVVCISADASETNATAVWSKNIIIDHLTADASSTTSGYTFKWSTGNSIDKFWPIEEQLLFLAYSPANLPTTEAANNVWRDSTTIQIKLPAENKETPDILYADNPVANKTNFTVNLGTFRHIFSQVSIKVKGKEVNPAIYLSQLTLKTSSRASYNIPLQKMNVLKSDIAYNLLKDSDQLKVLNSNEFILEAAEETPFFVFPDIDSNQCYTKVTVQLVDSTHTDKPVTLTHTYNINQFLKPDNSSALLERGTRTTLVINIKGSTVGTGTEMPQLTAESEKWSSKGDFGININ